MGGIFCFHLFFRLSWEAPYKKRYFRHFVGMNCLFLRMTFVVVDVLVHVDVSETSDDIPGSAWRRGRRHTLGMAPSTPPGHTPGGPPSCTASPLSSGRQDGWVLWRVFLRVLQRWALPPPLSSRVHCSNDSRRCCTLWRTPGGTYSPPWWCTGCDSSGGDLHLELHKWRRRGREEGLQTTWQRMLEDQIFPAAFSEAEVVWSLAHAVSSYIATGLGNNGDNWQQGKWYNPVCYALRCRPKYTPQRSLLHYKNDEIKFEM